MTATVEIVKTVGGKVLYDEVDEMSQCPGCGTDVAASWHYCNCCGEELDGDLPAFRTCSNAGDSTVFVCSECGRRYVPVQIRPKGDPVAEWNCCPGCMAVVV